jgi:hypothetical protein
MAFQKNILKYICSEKITHNAINEGCHINFYGSNMGSLLHYSISLSEVALLPPQIFFLRWQKMARQNYF